MPTESDAPAAPAAPETAAQVLTRHVQALGGEAALRKIAGRTTEARMTFLPDEGCTEDDGSCIREPLKGSFMLHTTADGRMYRRTVVGELIEERGFDGTRGWQVLLDGTVRLETPEEAAVSREDAFLHWYLDPEKRGIEMELLPARTIEDSEDGEGTRTLDGLRWILPGDMVSPKELWFDRTSGLLREEVVVDGAGEQATRQTISYLSYRTVDGVKVPEKIELETASGPQRRVVEFFTTQVRHETLPDDTFAVPTPVAPPAPDDPFLTALTAARTEAEAAPKDATARVGLARAAYAAAHFDEAKAAARKTLSLQRDEPEALWILARVAVLEGDLSGAKSLLARAEKAGVRPAEIARQRAWIASHRRDYRALAAALDAAGLSHVSGRYRMFTGKVLGLSSKSCRVTLPLARTEPSPAVKLSLGGREVLAMIDTGATDTILDADLADAIGLARPARSKLGPSGPEVQHGVLGRLALGEASLLRVPVDVFQAGAIAQMAGDAPKGGGKAGDGAVQVVLGMRTLEPFQVTFDLPGGTVELVPRTRRCKGELARARKDPSVPLWVHETHYLYVPAQLGPAEGLFLVNTGMRDVALTANRAAFARGKVAPPVVEPGKPAMVTVPALTLGEAFSAKDVRAAFGYFDQNQTSGGFRVDGMIGLEVLGQRRFTLDLDTARLYIHPPG